jgi:anti-sigma regulatory factor (Ser/Thr protein kinase)
VILLSASDDFLLIKFRSDITFVDVAVQTIGNLLEYYGIEDPTNILLVSRELLKNAVVHGSHNNKNKEVVFRLFRISRDLFRLEIEDSGQGSGLRHLRTTGKVPDARDGESEAGGRGFTIINSLSEQVLFSETGNRITVLLEA